MKKKSWFERLFEKKEYAAYGESKHSRGWAEPKTHRKKRKKARKRTKKSRKKNR